MSEINRINNDLVVDDMVYRPSKTLPNQNIEGHLCIKYNGKVLEFKDKDCANYVYNLRKLLKGAREVLKMVDTYCGDYDSINGFLIVEKINQVLGEE